MDVDASTTDVCRLGMDVEVQYVCRCMCHGSLPLCSALAFQSSHPLLSPLFSHCQQQQRRSLAAHLYPPRIKEALPRQNMEYNNCLIPCGLSYISIYLFKLIPVSDVTHSQVMEHLIIFHLQIASPEHPIIQFYNCTMPPKKQDPEQQKKDFEAWKEGDEFKKMDQVHKELKSLPPISETSVDSDLSGKFQLLWDQFHEMATLIKAKPPFKRIEHEWVRSVYFGEKKKQKPTCFYDGMMCEHENVEADSQHNLRQVFIKKIYNIFEDIKSIDETNYTKTKAELKKAFLDFFKLMKVHIKKSYKLIYEDKLIQTLQTLVNLLEINMKLMMFDLKYQTKEDKIINGFKYKAFVDKYCCCLQEAMKVLSTYHNTPIKHTPDVRMIFKKIEYEHLTKIEAFYVEPLREAFENMKQGLAALFTTGINFWKVPLETNTRFVDDLKVVIKWELITERLFGNDLLRDQINFISDTLEIIQKANPLAEKYMLQEDSNVFEISIPRLVAFRTIQHMRSILDRKIEERLRHPEVEQPEEESKPSESPMDKKLSMTQNQLKLGATTLSKVSKVSEVQNIPNEVQKLEEEQRKKYGRYWLWVNYCDEEHKKVFEEAVQMLRHINKAVHHDIQDAYIREGMLPRRDRQNQQLKEAAEELKNMKTIDNANKSENIRRPPELWNFPKVIEEEHKFRSIADPKKSYIDGRVEELDAKIALVSDHLRKHNKRDWDELVRRVIDFYRGKPDGEPHF